MVPYYHPIDPVSVKIDNPGATPEQVKRIKEARDLRNLELAVVRKMREDEERLQRRRGSQDSN